MPRPLSHTNLQIHVGAGQAEAVQAREDRTGRRAGQGRVWLWGEPTFPQCSANTGCSVAGQGRGGAHPPWGRQGRGGPGHRKKGRVGRVGSGQGGRDTGKEQTDSRVGQAGQQGRVGGREWGAGQTG